MRITPRLENAVTRAIERLDESIAAGATAIATMCDVMTIHAVAAAREELDGDKALRAELAAALDEARTNDSRCRNCGTKVNQGVAYCSLCADMRGP